MDLDDATTSKKRKVKKEEDCEEDVNAAASATPSLGVNGVPTDDGIAWSLGANKMLRVKQFKGKTYIDIREFYEDKDTGEKKPGKKGIMINVEQWGKITQSIAQIQETVDGGL